MAAGRDDLILKRAGLRGGPCTSMRTRGEGILHFTANSVQAGQHFSGQAHHSCGFRHVTAHARVEIDPVAHWHMAHVLHAADRRPARHRS